MNTYIVKLEYTQAQEDGKDISFIIGQVTAKDILEANKLIELKLGSAHNLAMSDNDNNYVNYATFNLENLDCIPSLN